MRTEHPPLQKSLTPTFFSRARDPSSFFNRASRSVSCVDIPASRPRPSAEQQDPEKRHDPPSVWGKRHMHRLCVHYKAGITSFFTLIDLLERLDSSLSSYVPLIFSVSCILRSKLQSCLAKRTTRTITTTTITPIILINPPAEASEIHRAINELARTHPVDTPRRPLR